jgi:hypothetical protein
MHWWGDHEPSRDPEDIARFLTEYFYKRVHPDFESIFGLPCTRSDLAAATAQGIRATPEKHQIMLLFNLEHPRSIMQQLYYLGREYHVSVPYYDAELIRTWFSVPPSMYRNKSLLKALYRSRWPRVASIPHSESRPSAWPRSLPAAMYLIPWAGDYLLNRAQNTLLPASMRRPDRTDIWHTWAGMTREEVRRQTAFIEEHRGVIREVLGWEPPPGDVWSRASLDPGKANSMLRSVYLLTEYCGWLRRTVVQPVRNPS